MRNEHRCNFFTVILIGVAMLFFAGPSAAGDGATMSKRDQLRSAPYLDANVGAALPAESRVEVVDERGAWIKVRASGKEGWLRATSLRRQGVTAPPVAALALASGRNLVTTPTASLGIRGATLGGKATHALILTISKYKDGIPELPGVQFDAAKAAAMAKSLGVDAENIRFLKNDEVTVDGIDRALGGLFDRIDEGDQVFIYYSGHGGRVIVLDPEPRCAEALVSVTGDPYVDSRLEAQLKRLSQKAGKIIAFFDACHSGGVATRNVKIKAGGLRPKSWNKGDAEACVKPVNVITRGLAMPSVRGSGAGNFVYIAAARDNEIALDHPTRGGIATSAWGECIAGAASDRDASGGLSALEIQECAQQKIDAAVQGNRNVLPHHVTITGNANSVVAFPRLGPAQASIDVRPTSTSLVGTLSGGSSVPAAPSGPTVAQGSTAASSGVAANTASAAPQRGPAATLNDLYSNRDDRRVVDVVLDKPVVKIGSDKVSMSISSSAAGYVYVVMAGSDGRGFDLVFPNQLDHDNYIGAGSPLKLPRPSWELLAQGPVGADSLLVLVSDAPREFSSLPLRPTGPFSVVETSAVNAKDIQLVFGGAGNATPGCKEGPEKRNLAVGKRCSTAYGAALVRIEEVR